MGLLTSRKGWTMSKQVLDGWMSAKFGQMPHCAKCGEELAIVMEERPVGHRCLKCNPPDPPTGYLRKWTAAARNLVAGLERHGMKREEAQRIVREALELAGIEVERGEK